LVRAEVGHDVKTEFGESLDTALLVEVNKYTAKVEKQVLHEELRL
jgi:hypothetical protein